MSRNGWDCRVVPRGCHRSTFSWRPFLRSTRTFEFWFPDTARYIIDPVNQQAINKLVGFSDGTLNHHKNSFRIGWNYDVEESKINIFFYTYIDGVRVHYFVKTTYINQRCRLDITCMKGYYAITLDKVTYKIPRSKGIRYKYKHMLWPYFGGICKSPRDISHYIKW